MATITEIHLKSGLVRYKATIKRDGKILQTKCWPTRKAAQTWARRVENDHSMMEALDSGMATMTFAELAREYLNWWYEQNRGDRG